MAKLANCPVCGVEPETRMDDEFGFPLYSVGCECCTMGTGYLQKKSDARKLWNEHANRAPVWISVKDRLPDAADGIIGATGEPEVLTICKFAHGWFPEVIRVSNIREMPKYYRYWMPLAEPPKEELPHNRYYSGDGIASDRT